MRERPIVFSYPLVRHILAGQQTQTRRILKLPKWAEFDPDGKIVEKNKEHSGKYSVHDVLCPYGQPGDRLWIREAWAYHPDYQESVRRVIYRVDPGVEHDVDIWQRPIFMPRWAGRIKLEITGVRVERLQDISEADAKAEGCSVPEIIYPDEPREHYSYASAYRSLWKSINGPGSWNANPWVWAIEFNRVQP